MKYLLDTMVWLWSVGPIDKISSAGLEILKSGEEEVYLSAASSWERQNKSFKEKKNMKEEPT